DLEVINKRLVNWTMMPFPAQQWAEIVYPELDGETALARLTEELTHVCRLDEDDPVAAWRERRTTLHSVAERLTERRFDAMRLEGPGTNITIGLPPPSVWAGGPAPPADGLDPMPK